MKKIYFIMPLILSLTSCDFINQFFQEDNTSESISDINKDSTIESISEKLKESNSEDKDINSESYDEFYEEYLELDSSLNMFVNQKYYIKDILSINKNINVNIIDSSILSYSNGYLNAKKEGKTMVKFELNGYHQDLTVNVSNNDKDATTFHFNKENLYEKKIAFFGDSVTAEATIANEANAKTYATLFKETFNMSIKNYAIGGTTATYTYFGSNIYKEYHTNTSVKDGPTCVKEASEKGELDNIDYVFIAYGHNDQYFQPALDSEDKKENYDNINACVSVKASYRYMIRKIREKSPNARIVLLNCTYSEYDKNAKTYARTWEYEDYRKAIKELATDFNTRLVDPWDYTKTYFTKNGYYRDVVHLSTKGHKMLFDFIVNQ